MTQGLCQKTVGYRSQLVSQLPCNSLLLDRELDLDQLLSIYDLLTDPLKGISLEIPHLEISYESLVDILTVQHIQLF